MGGKLGEPPFPSEKKKSSPADQSISCHKTVLVPAWAKQAFYKGNGYTEWELQNQQEEVHRNHSDMPNSLVGKQCDNEKKELWIWDLL